MVTIVSGTSKIDGVLRTAATKTAGVFEPKELGPFGPVGPTNEGQHHEGSQGGAMHGFGKFELQAMSFITACLKSLNQSCESEMLFVLGHSGSIFSSLPTCLYRASKKP